MEHQQLEFASRHEERALHLHGERVSQEARGVEVVTVDSSWWNTRHKVGVHILEPSVSQLELAKRIAVRAGRSVVYCYRKNPR